MSQYDISVYGKLLLRLQEPPQIVDRYTVKQVVYKWRKFTTIVPLPKTGQPIKITPANQKKEPRVK